MPYLESTSWLGRCLPPFGLPGLERQAAAVGRGGEGVRGKGQARRCSSAAKMPKTRRPFAIVVSISVLAPASTCRPTPRPCSSSTVVTGCFRFASEAVECPDDKGVTRLQDLEAGRQARAVIMASRGAVFVNALFVDADIKQGVALHVEELGTVCLGDARAADQHGVCTPIQNRRRVSCDTAKKYAPGCLVRTGGFLDMVPGNANIVRFRE